MEPPDPATALACHQAAALIAGLIVCVLIRMRESAWNTMRKGTHKR